MSMIDQSQFTREERFCWGI